VLLERQLGQHHQRGGPDDALRGLLIGVPTNLWLDVAVLIAAAVAGIVVSSALLPRLAK